MPRAPKYLPQARGAEQPLTKFRPDFNEALPFNEELPYRGPARMGRPAHVGDLTGCARPPYPQVHRRFGRNTRATVVGLRDTGVLDNRYDKNLVQSHPVPPVIPASAVLGQNAAPSLLAGIRAFEPGAHHWLFGS